MPRNHTAYVFGEDDAPSLQEARTLVAGYLGEQLDNGPGWLVTHNDDVYEIRFRVTLDKKPPRGLNNA